jgi:NarL family two-component system response regulator LiaR
VARILVADDSEIMRKHLKVTLNRQDGWTVCGETSNGLKAVLLAHELKPDLVILDLVMPMLDGLTAAAEIAKILPDVPIVIYSVQIQPELEVEARKFGVWAMVSKSAGPDQLIETVERLLAASQPALLSESTDAGIETRVAKEGPNDFEIDSVSEASEEPN